MIHIPAAETFQEMLKVPHLVRMTEAKGEIFEPTLIIRSDTLSLKFLVQNSFFDLLVTRTTDGILCYALKIDDDEERPLMFWSAAKTQSELTMFAELLVARRLFVALFNEACVNVACSYGTAEIESIALERLRNCRTLGAKNEQDISGEVKDLTDHYKSATDVWRVHVDKWNEVDARYITNGLEPCRINC